MLRTRPVTEVIDMRPLLHYRAIAGMNLDHITSEMWRIMPPIASRADLRSARSMGSCASCGECCGSESNGG
jgi:hypothetical protein